MARLSREKKREQKQAAHAATPAATPIEVRVHGSGTGPRGAFDGMPAGASVGGVPVAAEPGQEIQQAVLNRLHRIALAGGHPVHATVHDERIGYVVPLRVDTDGSSHFTAEPVRTGSPRDTAPTAPAPSAPPAPVPPASAPAASAPSAPAAPVRPAPAPAAPEPSAPPVPAPAAPASAPAAPAAPASAAEAPAPGRDKPTHILRPADEETRDSAPTFRLRAVPESPASGAEPVPTFALRAVPEPAGATPPGTVLPPTGEFGPPPAMDTVPADARPAPVRGGQVSDAVPEPRPESQPQPLPPDASGPSGAPSRPARRTPEPVHDLGPEPDPKPTPARGFDAVAEAVLGDGPPTAGGAAPALLAEPVGRINEAVKAGRIDTAARLAEDTVAQASETLGPEHPEVLRLRELSAYIAYLAGDPVRAFRLSLDLAGIHRRAGDAEAAYGNVQSAATAWRAVRDPLLGLELGGELIGLWTGLTAEDGPAADDIEQLESARARMGRLTARAGR
ncbi:tetratricopeptide repeat protein [Streptomyces sp. NPDC085946]|uniref:tetratricopeptide repeat protein n=1 Tax=Streptomyces sp. NPDC085946 TaxID=3365744 RepID=UPI0037CE69C6